MKHHIIVKWNEQVQDKKAILSEIDALFQNTTSIEGIRKVELISNIINRPNRYDLMIVIFMDEAALPVYDECIWHKQWKEEYGKYIASKAIFDSEE